MENIGIARPYARAIFELAIANQGYTLWSNLLAGLEAIVQDKEAANFLSNPTVASKAKVDFVLAVMQKQSCFFADSKNLIGLLINNNRILLLPSIRQLYEQHNADLAKRLTVTLVSARDLTKIEREQITRALVAKYAKKIDLLIEVDPGLLGGALIRISDTVLDWSIKGRLQALHKQLLN